MARRGFGSTALRAALGAVAGGLEGAQQAEALRRKQKLDEENAAFSRASVLSSLGLRPTMVRDTEDPAARNVVSLEQPSFAPRGSSPALASALQQGMGVDTSARSLSKPTTMSTANPLTTALDTATTRMKDFERQQSSLPANPAMQMQLPGVGRIGFRGPETEEEKAEQELAKFEGQQGVLEKREQGKFDRENRGYFDVLKKAGEIPSDATFEMYRNIPLKPAFDEYKQQVSMAGAMDRAKLMAGSQSQMGSYVTGTPEGAETPQILFGTRGGQLTPTGVQAPTKPTESKIPPADKKSMIELEASIKEIDKALASVEASPKAFGIKTVLPNVALTRTQGVKPRADVVGAIVKLRRTEFGTAMSRQEKESGESLFPAGGDSQETLKDKLTALREKAQLELDTKREYYGTQPAAAPPPAAKAATEDPDFTAAKAAIAAGKDRNAVIQRYQSSGKKWPGGA